MPDPDPLNTVLPPTEAAINVALLRRIDDLDQRVRYGEIPPADRFAAEWAIEDAAGERRARLRDGVAWIAACLRYAAGEDPAALRLLIDAVFADRLTEVERKTASLRAAVEERDERIERLEQRLDKAREFVAAEREWYRKRLATKGTR